MRQRGVGLATVRAAVLGGVLAGCAAPPLPPPVVPVVPEGPIDVTPGLNEREPDTCKAAGLQGMVGQPSGNVRTVPLPGPYRIVAPGQMVDQNEYRSDRLNFHVDAEGIILRIGCG